MAGKGAAELWGSSKNDTDLQQNHKNDRVDNRIVVISDLKKRNKTISRDKEVNNNACFTSLVAILKYATFGRFVKPGLIIWPYRVKKLEIPRSTSQVTKLWNKQ